MTTEDGLVVEILDATKAHKWLGCLLSTLKSGNREAAFFWCFFPRSFFPPWSSHLPGCLGSLGAGWEAAGIGAVVGRFGEHLAEEGLP